MTAPNMLSLTSITGNTQMVNLTTNAPTQLLSNAAASNQVYKINAIYASNVDATLPYPITINIYNAAALGGTAFSIVTNLNVAIKSTVVITDKDSNLYLSENMSLGATAGTGNKFIITVTYEVCQ